MSSASEPSFVAELKRRKVVRVAIAYAGVAAAMLEAAERTFSVFEIDANITRVMVLSAMAGMPVVLVLSWVFDLTARGVVKTPSDGEAPAGGISGVKPGRFTWQMVVGSALVVLVMTGAGWRYLPNDRVDFSAFQLFKEGNLRPFVQGASGRVDGSCSTRLGIGCWVHSGVRESGGPSERAARRHPREKRLPNGHRRSGRSAK